jgi:hypothetical protein
MAAGTQARPKPSVCELAHRTGSGIEVSLLWRRVDDSIALRLVEVATGVEFELRVPSDDALDAFYHPYAYLPTHAVDPWQESLAA